MKKICICGEINKTQNLLSCIQKKCNDKILIQPLKNKSSIVDFVILNKNKNIRKRTYNINCKILIINTDLFLSSFSYKKANYIITVGLNNHSCVTLSSISENKFQFCIRQTLYTITGKPIYEQEFTVNTKTKNINTLLSVVTTAILCDIKICDIKNIFF